MSQGVINFIALLVEGYVGEIVILVDDEVEVCTGFCGSEPLPPLAREKSRKTTWNVPCRGVGCCLVVVGKSASMADFSFLKKKWQNSLDLLTEKVA